jgi:hypothetical protein
MQDSTFNSPLQIIALSVIIAIILAYKYLRVTDRIKNYFGSPKSPDINTQLIMAYYTNGFDLMPLEHNKIDNMRYSVLITTAGNQKSETLASHGTLIYVLQLPFNTQTHIIGVSKKYQLEGFFLESFLAANNMEEIFLEGDFIDKCNIYTSKGQGFLTQYILDPKAMEFIVDFCENYFWEIAGDELTLVKTKDQTGEADLIGLSARFVKEIKPAIKQSGEPVKHDPPYGIYDGKPLPCPLCKSTMIVKNDWLECPSGHGILINARNIIKFINENQPITEAQINEIKHNQVKCPNCGTLMDLVNYQNTGIIIDSCTKCPFRWLDASEATKITAKL